MLPGNRLMLRVRDPEELMRFVNVFMQIATSNYQVNPSAWDNDVHIKGGTPHTISLHYDPQCLRRVAAKIGYALFRMIANGSLEGEDDLAMRLYILGEKSDPDEPVAITPDPVTFTTSNEPHYFVLSPAHDPTATIVSLYGLNFRVELGSKGVMPNPIVLVCAIDGSGMRSTSAEETEMVIEKIRNIRFSQPWQLATSSEAPKA